MYPYLRLSYQMAVHRRSPKLGVTETHESRLLCWPWDLDMWMELNNGRTLTLYDLGRLPMAQRTGMIDVLKARGWGITVAGGSVRYRRRVRIFDRITMKSRAICWDDKFVYTEQSMWVKGTCTSHALLRLATTGPDGIVPPAQVVAAMGSDAPSPRMPDWVAAWIRADADRPWPPMQDG